jgi:GH24 family phage-related lysozyme (muramidase)
VTDYSFLDPSIPRQLAVDIDAAEADKLTAYQDSLGNWTIGRGHLMPRAAPGRSWEGFTIIQSTSDRFFNGDLLDAMRLASKWPEFPKCDTECRQNALREIAFNMGGRWGTFIHARAAIEAQNWQEVHDQLLNSAWAGQVHGRATRIANYFLTGEYPSGAAGT